MHFLKELSPFEIIHAEITNSAYYLKHIKTGTRKTFLFFVEEPDSIRMKPYSCTREALSHTLFPSWICMKKHSWSCRLINIRNRPL